MAGRDTAQLQGGGPGDLDLILLGDVMLGRIVDAALTADNSHFIKIWGDFLPYLRGDISRQVDGTPVMVAGNLECAVTSHEERWPKTFNFKLSPRNVQALKEANFSYVSLANNHSLDFMHQGLKETVEVLAQEGIAYSGVGTEEEASRPAYVQAPGPGGGGEGLRVAFLSYSDHYDEWAATGETVGINFIDPHNFDPARVARDVAAAREGIGGATAITHTSGGGGGVSTSSVPGPGSRAHLVAVFCHWGPNWRWAPSSSIRALGHAFVDAGADLVFGHSSHHVQGIEVYRNKPIVYGAGGFIDDYALDDAFRNDLGAAYVLRVRGRRPVRLDLLPSRIHHEYLPRGSEPPYVSYVSRAHGDDRVWVEETLCRLCKPFGTRLMPLAGGEEGLGVDLREGKEK